MSLAHAKQFLAAIEGDSALQARITATNWDMTVILREAAARSLLFTNADFQSALDDAFGVLSEDTLVNAAGGGNGNGNGNGNGRGVGNGGNGNGYPHDNPPPGQNRTAGGTWSPPPGDVSGNSCLFGWRG